jgi:tubulin monoglycylase TTLL3/8
MLDNKLNPWLLEVNLSPACAERTEWLIKMLDNATDHLFDILENKILELTDDFLNPIKQYLIS